MKPKSNLPGLSVRVVVCLGVAGALAALACSSSSGSSSSSSCLQSPWTCGAGKTCWPDCVCPAGKSCTQATCTLQFACLPSAHGVAMGSVCSLVNGVPQCGDVQTCVSYLDGGGGSCQPFCDQSQMCPAGLVCTSLSVGGVASAVERVCVPASGDLDGGFMIESGSGSGGGGDGASPDGFTFDGPIGTM